jgi:hypothetical protein
MNEVLIKRDLVLQRLLSLLTEGFLYAASSHDFSSVPYHTWFLGFQISFYEDFIHLILGALLDPELNFIFKRPCSKHCHILRYWV